MKRAIKIGCIVFFAAVSSCTVSTHSMDRAIMMDEGEVETAFYGTLNAGSVDANLGAGGLFRIGVTDQITLGFEADYNLNTSTPDWVDLPQYARFMFDQKWGLVQDILAFKTAEGFYLNNYFGDVVQNEETGVYTLTNPQRFLPSAGSEFIFTPFGRRIEQQFQPSLFLQGNLAITSPYTLYNFGAGARAEFHILNKKLIISSEVSLMFQQLKKDGTDGSLNFGFGIHFLHRKKNKKPQQ